MLKTLEDGHGKLLIGLQTENGATRKVREVFWLLSLV